LALRRPFVKLASMGTPYSSETAPRLLTALARFLPISMSQRLADIADRPNLPQQSLLPFPETAITNHLRHLRRAISTYIPADTLQVELDPAAPAPPAGTFFEGSVLIADISGFSSLTE